MLYIFENGCYSSRHNSPAVEGPDNADIPALVAEWARAAWAARPEWARDSWFNLEGNTLFTDEAGFKALGSPYDPSRDTYWCDTDHFAAWLVLFKGWRAPAQRNVAIDAQLDAVTKELGA